jgi:hypothetical protein
MIAACINCRWHTHPTVFTNKAVEYCQRRNDVTGKPGVVMGSVHFFDGKQAVNCSFFTPRGFK